MSSNDPFEDRLRQVLLAEAQTVTPAGDGLSQIRAKVARRDRLRWLRPGLAVATAAALSGAAVFAFSLQDSAERTLKQEHPATRPPASSAPAVVPPTATLPTPVTGTSRAYPIWPYTSVEQAQRSGPVLPYRDPIQTAKRFMYYLNTSNVDKVLDDRPETTSAGAGRVVTLGRRMADGTVRAVTVVHLIRLGTGSTAPYAVTRAAGAYTLKITSPGIAAPVSSPLTVVGSIDGVHQSVRVELRTPADQFPFSLPVSAPASATTGWQATVLFNAPGNGIGTLAAITESDAGDGALQITAQPVLLHVPAVPALGRPVVKPAVEGDMDGDGRPDTVTVAAAGGSAATVSARLTRLGRQTLAIEIGQGPGLPVLMGIVDIDADGYAEAFVKVRSGASTGFASIVRLVNGRLAVIVGPGGQEQIPYGGTVTHLSTFGCAELDPTSPGRELFTWGGQSSDGVNYRGMLYASHFRGDVLLSNGGSPRNATPSMPAPSGCGSLRFP